jgi:CSLREA domain-containing protein
MRRLALAGVVVGYLLAVPAAPALGATFTVNSTGDQADADTGVAACDVDAATGGDQCTLRAAIEQSNASTTVNDNIDFAVGTGAQTITPATALPDITDAVVIDGVTQTGTGAPLITVKGAGTNSFDGLTVTTEGDNSHINRLVLNNFKIAVRAEGRVQIDGNYIGIAQDGTAAAGSPNSVGIRVTATSGGVGQFGGSAADRNVISNNDDVGIDVVSNGATFQIFNNYIGTNPAGTAALGNGTAGVRVGSVAEGEVLTGNVISGNAGRGVLWSGTHGFISGSYIGTNASGTGPLPNTGEGVLMTSGDPNITNSVISGNGIGGLRVTGTGDPTVSGNKIGVGADGTTAIGNTGAGGIDINGSGATIGGQGGNVIANNSPWGVRIRSGTGNRIQGNNSIFGNTGLGIDLDPVMQFNPNDTDPNLGAPNLGQNYPSLTSAVAGGNVTGTLTSQANRAYDVDLFASPTCDPSFYGEGQTFLKTLNVTTDQNGTATFSTALPGNVSAGQVITATATDSVAKNTSEFSLCRTVTAASTTAPGSGQAAGGSAGGSGSTATQKANGEPDSNIGKIAKRADKLKAFSGTASDPENQLAAVEIAVLSTSGGARATAKRVKRCLNLQGNGRLKRKKAGKGGRCGPTNFLRAKRTTKWSYKLKHRLKRGNYVIYARAVDKAGGKETKFSKADRNRLAFKLR